MWELCISRVHVACLCTSVKKYVKHIRQRLCIMIWYKSTCWIHYRDCNYVEREHDSMFLLKWKTSSLLPKKYQHFESLFENWSLWNWKSFGYRFLWNSKLEFTTSRSNVASIKRIALIRNRAVSKSLILSHVKAFRRNRNMSMKLWLWHLRTTTKFISYFV